MMKNSILTNLQNGKIPESNDSVQARQVSLAKGASQVLALHGGAGDEEYHGKLMLMMIMMMVSIWKETGVVSV